MLEIIGVIVVILAGCVWLFGTLLMGWYISSMSDKIISGDKIFLVISGTSSIITIWFGVNFVVNYL